MYYTYNSLGGRKLGLKEKIERFITENDPEMDREAIEKVKEFSESLSTEIVKISVILIILTIGGIVIGIETARIFDLLYLSALIPWLIGVTGGIICFRWRWPKIKKLLKNLLVILRHGIEKTQ